MIKRILFLSLATLTTTAALADDLGFTGKTAWGHECRVQVSRDGDRATLTVTAGRTYAGLPLAATGEGLAFDALTIDRGGNTYSPPIGAPITFGNIGLLQVSGLVQLDSEGQPSKVSLRAVGGLANWYRTSFTCTR